MIFLLFFLDFLERYPTYTHATLMSYMQDNPAIENTVAIKRHEYRDSKICVDEKRQKNYELTCVHTHATARNLSWMYNRSKALRLVIQNQKKKKLKQQPKCLNGKEKKIITKTEASNEYGCERVKKTTTHRKRQINWKVNRILRKYAHRSVGVKN